MTCVWIFADTITSFRAFQDILHDSAQLSCFRSYLQSQGEGLVLPLDFWQLISELKTQLGEGQKAIRAGQPTLKVEDIHDEFFTVDADKRRLADHTQLN